MKGARGWTIFVLAALLCACQKAETPAGTDPWYSAEPIAGQSALTYKTLQTVTDKCSDAFLVELWKGTLAVEPDPVDIRGAVFNSVSRYVWDQNHRYQVLSGWMSIDQGNNGISVSGFYRYDEKLNPLIVLGFDKWNAHAEVSILAWDFPLILFRSSKADVGARSGNERAAPGEVPLEVRLLNGGAGNITVPMKVWSREYPKQVSLNLGDYVACLKKGLNP